eukprot:8739407-Alexandrium_andersonii.AAC.1
MQTLRRATRTLALLATQGGVTSVLGVGGAEPLARPNSRTAGGLPSRGAARLRLGRRPNSRAAQAAPIPGLVARSQSQAASEPLPGRL